MYIVDDSKYLWMGLQLTYVFELLILDQKLKYKW